MNNDVITEKEIAKKRLNPRLWFAQIQEKIASCPSAYLAYCFLIPVAVMYLIYLAMEIHPFGSGSVLVLDLNGQYVYFFEALRNTVYGEGSFLYTFFRGLGGEFMGMYAYYLASPLSYIVALFPQERILEALLTIILLKVGLCGFSFGFYLHKNTAHPNKIITIAFSLMYALCAYAVVYQNNIMWIDALIWLPLLTYSIEQMIKNRRYKLFVISLALTVMSNYYIGYMVCIYVLLYFCYYMLSQPKEVLNPRNEKLHPLRSLIQIALFSLLALAIAAFVIFGAYYSLSFGKNVFSNPNWSFQAKFDFLDFFTKFLPGSYDTVRPEGLPFVYCGLLAVILLPIYFLSKKIPAKEKIVSVFFIAVFVLSFICSPLDLIWHGFQNPNWLNYRYSFMLCFFLLVLAYKGFGNLRENSEKFILGICAFVILFVTVCDKLEFSTYVENDSHLLKLETVWLTIFVTVAILVVLCLLIRQKHPRKRESLCGILAAVVCIEIFCSSLACVVQFDDDVAYSSYNGYNDFIQNLRPVTEQVKESDPGFYRMEKLVHRKYNDNMALGIRGLSNSTSTLNAETIQFLNRMGYTARSHLSQYKGGNPVNDSLLGVKYLIDSNTSKKLVHVYQPTFSDDRYTVYENPHALPIAYGVDDLTEKFNISRYDTYFDRLNTMVSYMLGDKSYPDIFRPVSDYETQLSSGCIQQKSGIQITYSKETEDSNATVIYSFTAPQSAEYYFYTPSRSPSEAELSVNGQVLGSYLGKDSNHIMSIGWFEANEEINISLELKNEKFSLYTYYDYLWYIDAETLEKAFGSLKSNPQFLIDEERYTEDHLIGTIQTAKENQMIQTTIPYDEGWKIYVDGAPVEIFKTMDALIAFDIEQSGEHTLEMKYSPKIYSVGLKLSIGGTVLFLLICAADTAFYFIRRKKHPEDYVLLSEPWILPDFDEDAEQLSILPPADPKERKKVKERISEFIRCFKKSKKAETDTPDENDLTKGDQ